MGVVTKALAKALATQIAKEEAARSALAAPAVMTKKAAREALYQNWVGSQVEPVVTQAARKGLKIGGAEQMAVQHPSDHGTFATIKSRVPQEQFSRVFEPTVKIPKRRIIDPAEIEGAVTFPLYGDRTDVGGNVIKIGDTEVNVPMWGGLRFAESNAAQKSKSGWATAPGRAVQALQENIALARRQGKRAIGIGGPMSPTSLDQSTMNVDAALQEAVQADIAKTHLAKFDKQVRTFLPDWPGMQHPEAMDYLTGKSQAARNKVVSLMESAPRLKQGFPDAAHRRWALTDPGLLEVPSGGFGYSLVEFGDDALKDFTPTLEHPTYSAHLPGKPLGMFGQHVPFGMLWPDFVAGRRATNQPAGWDLRALELGKPTQEMRPEVVDAVKRYMETAR